jgi:hypothetical protein
MAWLDEEKPGANFPMVIGIDYTDDDGDLLLAQEPFTHEAMVKVMQEIRRLLV